MSRGVSPSVFDAWVSAHMADLVAAAQEQVGAQDAPDVVQDALLTACSLLRTVDAARLEPWLYSVLANKAQAHTALHGRRSRRSAVSFEGMSRQQRAAAETYWVAVADADQRADEARAALRSEIKLRLRLAPLSQVQLEVLELRCMGASPIAIAHRQHCSRATVQRRLRTAIALLRATPIEILASADIDAGAWRSAGRVTVYHSPVKQGSLLATERLNRLH